MNHETWNRAIFQNDVDIEEEGYYYIQITCKYIDSYRYEI